MLTFVGRFSAKLTSSTAFSTNKAMNQGFPVWPFLGTHFLSIESLECEELLGKLIPAIPFMLSSIKDPTFQNEL